MARHVGNDGVIKIDGTTITVKAFDFESSAGVATTRAKGEAWQAATPDGGKSWSGSLTADLDEADAGQSALVEGATGTVSLYTAGEGSGLIEYSGAVVISQLSRSSPESGYASVTCQFTGNGALTRTVLP